jgi:hypothetical protein
LGLDSSHVDGSCLVESTAIIPIPNRSGGYFPRMRTVTRIFEWLYAQSLKLYPSDFREEFGEEMTAVFGTATNSIIVFKRKD